MPIERVAGWDALDVTPSVVRRAARDEPFHLQERLAASVDYYVRHPSRRVRGADLLSLSAITFSDGRRLYTLYADAGGEWRLRRGGSGPGRHGLADWEQVRIRTTMRLVLGGLRAAHDRLRRTPSLASTLVSATRALRAASGHSGVLRDLAVTGRTNRLMVSVRIGRDRVVDVAAWSKFRRGVFEPRKLAVLILGARFDVGPDAIRRCLLPQKNADEIEI